MPSKSQSNQTGNLRRLANETQLPNVNDITIEQHPLEPFLPLNAQILLLGSFPPPQKRWCMNFYYPNFSNDMWRVFGLVFFNDAAHFVNTEEKLFNQDRIVTFLNEKGIAIFDTASAIRRLQDNASDKFLEVVKPTDIKTLLKQIPSCTNIVTTGEKATETICNYFNLQPPKVGTSVEFLLNGVKMKLYRMPSTSRAYPLPIAKKAQIYSRMFDEIFDGK